MSGIFLGLGSNLSDRLSLINDCLFLIEKEVGAIVLRSSIYESMPWGEENQPAFLNMVIGVDTVLKPLDLLKATQGIENQLGRQRQEKWGARTIDIDILFYDNQIVSVQDLIIPHPLVNMRKFVLLPLMEIAPNFLHPVNLKNIKELYQECQDNLPIYKIDF